MLTITKAGLIKFSVIVLFAIASAVIYDHFRKPDLELSYIDVGYHGGVIPGNEADKPVGTTSVTELLDAFKLDRAKAEKKYINQVYLISGLIGEVEAMPYYVDLMLVSPKYLPRQITVNDLPYERHNDLPQFEGVYCMLAGESIRGEPYDMKGAAATLKCKIIGYNKGMSFVSRSQFYNYDEESKKYGEYSVMTINCTLYHLE